MSLVKCAMLNGTINLINSIKVMNPVSQDYGTQFYLGYVTTKSVNRSSLPYETFMALFDKRHYNATIVVNINRLNERHYTKEQVIEVDRVIKCVPVSNGTLIEYINTERLKQKKSIDKMVVNETINEIYDMQYIPINDIDDDSFHYSGALSTEWIINHNLNRQPSVTISDSSGTTYEAEVAYIDNNTVAVRFSEPFQGYADLN